MAWTLGCGHNKHLVLQSIGLSCKDFLLDRLVDLANLEA